MTSLSLTCSPGLRNPGFSQTYTSNLTFFFFCCYGKERQQDSGSDPDPDPEDGSGPCRSLVSYPGPSIHNQEQSGLEEIFQQGQCLQEALMVHIDPSDISRRSQAPHPPTPPHPPSRCCSRICGSNGGTIISPGGGTIRDPEPSRKMKSI